MLSVARRLARVASLHIVDASLLTGVAMALTSPDLGDPAARPYVPAMVGIFLLGLNALAAYQPGDARRDHRRLLSGVLLGLLILGCLWIFPPRLPFSLGFLATLGCFGFLALSLGRRLTDQVVRQIYLRGIGLRRALLIGELDEVGRVIQQLRDDQNIDQYLVGHLAPEGRPDPTALGTLAELPRIIQEMDVQEVILATALPPQGIRDVADHCFNQGIIFYVFPSVLGNLECKAEPVRVGGCPLLHLHPSRLRIPGLMLKRAFDLVLAVAALFVFAPVMVLIAAAIKLDSQGPVFFRQQRVGLGGRRFTMWKFRSMFVDADEVRMRLEHLNAYSDPRLFKLPDDPRITRVGRFLRRSSLDELPQFFNVLRGDMSLVGPRPPLPHEVAGYESHHFDRLAVVPGITGPWQVGGRNLITDFEEVVRMEREYIQSWSLLLDMKIVLRTVRVVITGEGAY